MNKNEEAEALESDGLINIRIDNQPTKPIQRRIDMNYSTTNQNKFQQKSPRATGATFNPPEFRFTLKHIICDECSAPLHLYGANFVESYANGKANVLRSLCDLHAEEFGFLEVSA